MLVNRLHHGRVDVLLVLYSGLATFLSLRDIAVLLQIHLRGYELILRSCLVEPLSFHFLVRLQGQVWILKKQSFLFIVDWHGLLLHAHYM